MGLHARRPLPRHRRRRRKGATSIDDVSAGDLWNFPAGIPHSIQGLEEEAASSCSCSTTATSRRTRPSSISDWFAHTPRRCLAKNFGVPEAAFANLPENVEKLVHLSRRSARPAGQRMRSPSPAGFVPESFTYRLLGPGADPQRRADRCASSIRPISRQRPRSPRPWSRSSRADARAALAPEHGRVAVLHLGQRRA